MLAILNCTLKCAGKEQCYRYEPSDRARYRGGPIEIRVEHVLVLGQIDQIALPEEARESAHCLIESSRESGDVGSEARTIGACLRCLRTLYITQSVREELFDFSDG